MLRLALPNQVARHAVLQSLMFSSNEIHLFVRRGPAHFDIFPRVGHALNAINMRYVKMKLRDCLRPPRNGMCNCCIPLSLVITYDNESRRRFRLTENFLVTLFFFSRSR